MSGRSGGARGSPGKPPTAKIIAERLGVSKSTVSRAMKDDSSISRSVRARVRQLADELGYRPNAAAQGLITRRSGIVGLIVGEGQNPFYAEQLDRLLVLLAQRNLQLMLFRVPDEGDVTDVIPIVLQYQLDACILASVSLSSRADEILAGPNLPTVLLNRVPMHHHTSAVLCNNIEGGRTIGAHLLENRARRIAFIAGPEGASTSRDREAGLRLALEEAGLPLHGKAIGHYSFDGGGEAMRALLGGRHRPDAVFAANDIMALGALDAARAAGLSIPADLQVAGFDNIRAAAWPAYDLTTIAQPMDSMLERAIEMIDRGEAGSVSGEAVYLNGSLIRRGSTLTA